MDLFGLKVSVQGHPRARVEVAQPGNESVAEAAASWQ